MHHNILEIHQKFKAYVDETREQHKLLQEENHRLRLENNRLKQENSDLRIALSTVSEHGDIIEAELQDMNEKLHTEMAIRLQAESTLKAFLDLLNREKKRLRDYCANYYGAWGYSGFPMVRKV